MDKTEQLKQIDAAWERVVEAAIFFDNISGKTADQAALDIHGLLERVNRQIGSYRARVRV